MFTFYYLYFISILTTIVGFGILGFGVDILSQYTSSVLALIMATSSTFLVMFLVLSSIFVDLFQHLYKYYQVKYDKAKCKMRHKLILSFLMAGHITAVYVMASYSAWIGIIVLIFAFGYVVKEFMDGIFDIKTAKPKEETE